MVASTTNNLEREDKVRDAEFNKALHGKSAQARGGMAAMFAKGYDAKKAAVDEYFKHFDGQSAKDETPEQRAVSTCPVHHTAAAHRSRLTAHVFRPVKPSTLP